MLECTIVSPIEQIDIESVQAVYARASTGEVGILPGHAMMVCSLVDESLVRIATAGGVRQIRVGARSFLEVKSNRITVLCGSFSDETVKMRGSSPRETAA